MFKDFLKTFRACFHASRSYQGRNVAPRRSTPSVNMANASARRQSLVVPGSIVFGQENVPFSKRLVSTHKPVPSQYRILIRVCRRLQKTKSAPPLGSSPRRSLTAVNNPLNPLRMSQGSTATNTLRLPEKLNMASPGREPRPPPGQLGWLHGFLIAHRRATGPPRLS